MDNAAVSTGVNSDEVIQSQGLKKRRSPMENLALNEIKSALNAT